MIKGLIFDMDGVLFDTELQYLDKKRAFFAQEEISCDDGLLMELRGLNPEECFRKVIPGIDDNTMSILKEKYRKFKYESEDFYISSIFPETADTLAVLYRQGYELALASSSPAFKIEKALKQTNIEKYFSFYLSGDDFKRSKPSPDIYLEACRRMKCEKSKIMVIEDSEYGIQAAKKAELQVTARREYRYPVKQENCDYAIRSLSELPELLTEISKEKEYDSYYSNRTW